LKSDQLNKLLAFATLVPGSGQQFSMLVSSHLFSSFFDDGTQYITSSPSISSA
jgi:hypothetical protein